MLRRLPLKLTDSRHSVKPSRLACPLLLLLAAAEGSAGPPAPLVLSSAVSQVMVHATQSRALQQHQQVHSSSFFTNRGFITNIHITDQHTTTRSTCNYCSVARCRHPALKHAIHTPQPNTASCGCIPMLAVSAAITHLAALARSSGCACLFAFHSSMSAGGARSASVMPPRWSCTAADRAGHSSPDRLRRSGVRCSERHSLQAHTTHAIQCGKHMQRN